MPTLRIKNFSCIDSAVVDLSRITVLIGPQASGKSIISKLAYFLSEVVFSQISNLQIRTDFNEFLEKTKSDFKKWFPETAWGDGRFQIEYESGPIRICLTRKKKYKLPQTDFNIEFSPFFIERFEDISREFQQAEAAYTGDRRHLDYEFRIVWKLIQNYRKSLSAAMGPDYIEYQMFVPAGRSFFTGVGKAIAAFDRGGFLDPATLEFGRFWANARDERFRPRPPGQHDQEYGLMSEIFGGELVRERDVEFVQAPDGRKVPLSALSSGQQELLPLWLALEAMFLGGEQTAPTMMYIEEPEAHLFPHAQSQLIYYLTRLVNGGGGHRRMFITTHSPYVLTTMNNSLQAGLVSKNIPKSRRGALSSILSRQTWLEPGTVSAYEIRDRKVVSILDDEGLIHGDYLDSVSSDILTTFDELVELEFRANKRGS